MLRGKKETRIWCFLWSKKCENWEKLLNLSKKNFIALKLKNINDEISNFFMNGFLQQNSELREAHHKNFDEIEEIMKFKSSSFDTIANGRGPGHSFGIYKQSSGFAKWN